jgi:hypothetical protein
MNSVSGKLYVNTEDPCYVAKDQSPSGKYRCHQTFCPSITAVSSNPVEDWVLSFNEATMHPANSRSTQVLVHAWNNARRSTRGVSPSVKFEIRHLVGYVKHDKKLGNNKRYTKTSYTRSNIFIKNNPNCSTELTFTWVSAVLTSRVINTCKTCLNIFKQLYQTCVVS